MTAAEMSDRERVLDNILYVVEESGALLPEDVTFLRKEIRRLRDAANAAPND